RAAVMAPDYPCPRGGGSRPTDSSPSPAALYDHPMFATLAAWAKRVRQDTLMLWFARSHPATPMLAKILCMLAVAYALSPIDLIPDFIPVLVWLDELIVLPVLIWLAARLLPEDVVCSCR